MNNNFIPCQLKVNNSVSPLNVEGIPQFSWWCWSEASDQKQTAYQIQVKDSNESLVWDSNKVLDSSQLNVLYAGEKLLESATYFWRVKVWNNDNLSSSWSNWSRFDMGISNDNWNGAKWLDRHLSADEIEGDRWTIARKEVQLKSLPIVSVRSYVAANHDYVLYINGQRADRGLSYAYPGEGYYQATDITSLCDQESLTIGLLHHWYGNGQGRPAGIPGFMVKIDVEYADGSHQIIVTDESWHVKRGPYEPASLRNGEGDHIEHFNAVMAEQDNGWQFSGFNDQTWDRPTVIGTHPTKPFTKVTGQMTRMTEKKIFPQRILQAADGTQVADFGKVYPIRPQIHFKHGQAGKVIHILSGYELTADGRVATDHVTAQGTDMSYYYTEKDGEQTFKAFTHLACRYVEVPDNEDFSLNDICGIVVHREMPEYMYAKFTSSNQMLNDVWNLMQRSLLLGVQQQFVDTPTREKGQFLVDAANESYGTMAVLGDRIGTKQALNEFLESQDRYWNSGSDQGRYNSVYPNGDGKRDIPDYTELFPDWVWRYYKVSGDLTFLRKAYPYLLRTADYIIRNIATNGPEKGLVSRLDSGSGPYLNGIVDWPAHSRFGYDMATTARTTVNVLGVSVIRSVVNVGSAINADKAQLDRLTSIYQNLIDQINSKLRLDNGLYTDGMFDDGTLSKHTSQLANSYAVAFDVAPVASRKLIADWLGQQGMKQGPMTVYWLLKALTDNDNNVAALKLLTNPNDFGWAQQVKLGRTFTPEAWKLSGEISCVVCTSNCCGN